MIYNFRGGSGPSYTLWIDKSFGKHELCSCHTPIRLWISRRWESVRRFLGFV